MSATDVPPNFITSRPMSAPWRVSLFPCVAGAAGAARWTARTPEKARIHNGEVLAPQPRTRLRGRAGAKPEG
jgi:hypothetical protein